MKENRHKVIERRAKRMIYTDTDRKRDTLVEENVIQYFRTEENFRKTSSSRRNINIINANKADKSIPSFLDTYAYVPSYYQSHYIKNCSYTCASAAR